MHYLPLIVIWAHKPYQGFVSGKNIYKGYKEQGERRNIEDIRSKEEKKNVEDLEEEERNMKYWGYKKQGKRKYKGSKDQGRREKKYRGYKEQRGKKKYRRHKE